MDMKDDNRKKLGSPLASPFSKICKTHITGQKRMLLAREI